jgi:S1-C subfamily serine protease
MKNVHALATLLALLLAGTASQRAGRRLVQRVMPGSSAERCGLRPGDFILAIASQPVQTYRQLYRVLVLRAEVIRWNGLFMSICEA